MASLVHQSSSLYPSGPRQRERPAMPKLSLNLNLVSNPEPTGASGGAASSGTGGAGEAGGKRSNDTDSPTYNYYGGPAPLNLPAGFEIEQVTLRPPLHQPSSQQHTGAGAVDDLGSLLREINDISAEEIHIPTVMGDTGSNSALDASSNSNSSAQQQEDWSDDRLEEIDRLGEGAGGAVHKVRDRVTNRIMARKTITTRETPPRQLVRELSFMKDTKHRNICNFFGAFISPSSSEVKVLMEICEGGSLEAVGKRINDGRGRIAEKVAGRIAEGVGAFVSYTQDY